DLEFAETRMLEFERREHPEYFQVKIRHGDVLARSPSLGSATLALPDTVPWAEPVSYDLELPGGVRGRAAVMEVVFGGGRLDIVVARDTVRLHRLFRSMALGFTGATLLLLLALALGLNHLVGRGLRPLGIFADQVVSVDEGTLDTRFSLPSLPVELQPIARQLDRLLERIAAGFQRERSLTSAMAHELYTPIAELRSSTEVALKWPDDPEAASAAVGEAHAIALQMQAVVNALLSLSRCEAGLQDIAIEPVEVSSVLEAISGSIAEPLQEKGIASTWTLEPGLLVETNRAMLEVVLSNLCRNVMEYTPRGGRVECCAEAVGGRCVVTLSNTQATLSEADLEHLCDPLWRKDKARSGSVHSGLGLAVAKRFCNLLGIQLAAALPEPGLFRVTLSIPVG
ncbi:MAG: HAMP domain-containing histidine kinase, partial [Verrucomicrobia bacterium]|nr:HAMP domain-containing histidine kinase [Verrucomicrobiota bacterium]